MVIGRIIFSLFQCWLMVVKQVLLLNFFNFIKIMFLWFFLAFSASYLFFLLCHKRNIAQIRQDIAIELSRSLGLAALLTTLVMALYECIIRWMGRSEFFDIHSAMLTHGSLMSLSNSVFYNSLSFTIVMLSALFAHHFVSPLLNCDDHHAVSDRYGMSMILISLTCWAFLWLIL